MKKFLKGCKMNKAKLLEWAERLLDTGKRSNLINYKRTKSTSLAVLKPSAEDLFARAEAGLTLDVCKGEKALLGLSADEYRESYPRSVRKNQILLYNEYTDADTVLNSMRKKVRATVEESGVNIAYLAFGFLDYRECGVDSWISAPLLLVPASIERESLASGIKIRVMDDEVTVNPALSFKLHAEYGAALPEYLGTGLAEYLATVRHTFASLGFKTREECVIGLFSFQKINMYRDIADNFDVISKSSLMSVLLGEPGAVVKDASARHGEAHPVVDADSSQLGAIEMARAGKSFVLEGPPGTGKSQTITNIIADSIMLGKKVLFVSEKLAALEVVYDKLCNAGLGEFCLELHSHKANKKAVIDEICKSAALDKTALSEKAEGVLTERLATVTTLDGYKEALYTAVSQINKCPRELISLAIEYSFYPNTEYVIEDIEKKGEDYLARAEAVLDEYSAYADERGMDYRKNPFYAYTGRQSGYKEELSLKKELECGIEWLEKLQCLLDELYIIAGTGAANIGCTDHIPDALEVVVNGEFVCPALFGDGAAKKVYGAVNRIKSTAQVVCAIEDGIVSEWGEGVLSLDADAFAYSIKKCESGIVRLFSKEYRRIKNTLCISRSGATGKGRVKYSEAVALAEKLAELKKARRSFDQVSSEISYYLGAGYKGARSDFDKLKEEALVILEAETFCPDLRPLARYSEGELDAKRGDLSRIGDSILEMHKNAPQIFKRFNRKEYNPYNMTCAEVREKLSGMLDNISDLASYISLSDMLCVIDELGIRGFVDKAISRGISAREIKGAYLRIFFTEWADTLISGNKYLASVHRIIHDREWQRFVKSDLATLDINKVKIKAAASNRRPDLDMVSQGSKISMLLREGEKKRRQMSIRRLFSELGDTAQGIKPCFLMSPISISTYLAPEMKFDIVIFDEASQVFPEDAFGAIYRASQLIVVGDSKQMPPTSFFASVTDEGEEWGESDAGDFESILDLASPTLPHRSLKWHYRSKSEELIAFSNKHFYNGELITFPSAKCGEGRGVEFVYAGGVFERGRKINEKEADEAVRLLFESFEKHPERSVGIVAFSTAQQAVIEDKINARRIKDIQYESYFAKENPERVFVKNLETVQGDERDTIIFSTAYGMGDDGRLLMNFGPLNREGGERRLNVAVTRAKYNLILVSSMHYTDIDPTRVTSRGALLLRDYLRYAECGGNVFEEERDLDDAICKGVCAVLSDNGVEFDTFYGSSRAKIDIAVKYGGEYILAIECDGGAFAESGSATDRERLRPGVLRGCGWQYHRIYSTDWYRNKNEEISRLLGAVREAVKNADLSTSAPKDATPCNDFECAAQGFEFPKYEYVDVGLIEKSCKGHIPTVIRAILEVEAPVAEEWLMRRLLYLFGKDRLTSYVEERFYLALNSEELADAVSKNGYLYLAGRNMPLMRVPDEESGIVREIRYIPKGEIALGMREIIRQNGTLSQDGLYRLISKKLGFPRLSDNIISKFDEALALLSGEVQIKEKADGETVICAQDP